MAARALLGPRLRQDSPRDVAVVEREHVGADDLIGLVALPGNHHRVAPFGPGESVADRDGAVGLPHVAARGRSRPAHAGHDLVDDRLRPLGAWIVGGHPYPVAEAGRDLPPYRPLSPNAVRAAAEDDPQPPARE